MCHLFIIQLPQSHHSPELMFKEQQNPTAQTQLDKKMFFQI